MYTFSLPLIIAWSLSRKKKKERKEKKSCRAYGGEGEPLEGKGRETNERGRGTGPSGPARLKSAA